MAETDEIDLDAIERDLADPERQLIRHVGDVTIVGVHHGVDTTKQKRPYQPFTDIINESDHLVLENRGGDPLNPQRHATFEDLARLRFTTTGKAENIHLLEEGYNKIDLLEQYGLDSRVVLLDQIVDITSPVAKNRQVPMKAWLQQQPQIVDALIESFVSDEKKSTIDKAKLTALAQEYTKVLFNPQDQSQRAQLIRSSMDGRSIVKLYSRDIRDYEKIGSRLLSLLPELKGKTSIVVGKSHVPNIESILRGRGMPQPKPWKTFLEEPYPHLDPRKVEAAELFTRIATGTVKTFGQGRFRPKQPLSRKR